MTDQQYSFVARLMEYEQSVANLVGAGSPETGKERDDYAKAKRDLLDFVKPYLDEPKAVIDLCDAGHTFAKAKIDGVFQSTRCPVCLAIGLADARRQVEIVKTK